MIKNHKHHRVPKYDGETTKRNLEKLGKYGMDAYCNLCLVVLK